MDVMKIKEIFSYMEDDVRKTKMVISEGGRDTEIILEGNGKLSVVAGVGN